MTYENWKWHRVGRQIRLAIGAGSLVLTLTALFALAGRASAQTISPVSRTADAGLWAGPSPYGPEGAAITQVDYLTMPGFVATATCTPGVPIFEVAIWKDTGSQLVNTGSYSSDLNCSQTSITSLFNTSSQGYTTLVTATAPTSGWGLILAAWQVGPSGSLTPLGTPFTQSTGWLQTIDITSLTGSMAATSAWVFESGSSQVHQVTTWNIAASGDITLLDNVTQPVTLNGDYEPPSITHLNSSQAVTAHMVNANQDLEVTAWAIDTGGNLTPKGVQTLKGPIYEPVIAPYFQGGDPAVITGFWTGTLGADLQLEFVTWGVSSAGSVTQQSTLNKGLSYSPAAITFIPSSLLTFAAVQGGNEVLDVIVLEQSGSAIDEVANYHTSWNYAPVTPRGAAVLSNNRVATLSYNAVSFDLEIEVWEYSN